MLKKQSKKLALLLVLTMITSLFTGVASVSAANGVAVSISRVMTAGDSQGPTQIGNLQIKEDSDYADAIATGDSFILTLPTNLKWLHTGNTYVDLNKDEVKTSGLEISISGNYTMTVKITDCDEAKKDVYAIPMFVNFDGVESGYAYINIDGMDSPIPSGEYAIAKILSGGTTAECIDAFTCGPDSEDTFTLRITETATGTFDEDEQVKFTLPSKIKFRDIEVNGLGGFSGSASLKTFIEDNKVRFKLSDLESAGMKINTSGKTSRGILEFVCKIDVNSSAKEGDVYLSIDGSKNIDSDSVKVGRISEYGVSIDADDAVTVLAGRTCQELGTVVIYENVSDTLIGNRSITLTLPDGVKFAGPYRQSDIEVKKGNADVKLTDADDDSLTFKLDINSNSERIKIEVPMKHMNIAADFEGDVVVKVDGRAGIDAADVVIGSVEKPVDIKVESTADVKCGFRNQALGNIVITETEAGALLEDGEVWIELPAGVEFEDKVVDVEVTDGNLEIGNVKVKAPTNKDLAYISFEIDSESSASNPSTVTISNLYLDVDRTVAEGPIKAILSGTALVWSYEYDSYPEVLREQYDGTYAKDPNFKYHENDDEFDVSDYLFDEDEMARFTIANCVTQGIENTSGIPENVKQGGATMVINSTSAIINGEAVTLPVAPYISNSRTLVPVRYIAYACGINENNIIWNPDNKTVTLVDGNGVVVQLTIGSNIIYCNGIKIMMDVAPQITGSYTFLPARWVANAFGYSVGWDGATKTVTIF